jgi:hypothetical protein
MEMPFDSKNRVDRLDATWPNILLVPELSIENVDFLALIQLKEDIFPFLASNQSFKLSSDEIIQSGLKVIGALERYAKTLFDVRAKEYVKHHPQAVIGTKILDEAVAPSVYDAVEKAWSKWALGVQFRLQREHERLVVHEFESRMQAVFADRIRYWTDAAKPIVSAQSASAQPSSTGEASGAAGPEPQSEATAGPSDGTQQDSGNHETGEISRANRRRTVVKPLLERDCPSFR